MSIENRIRDAFKAATPDMLDDIIESCKGEEQLKPKPAFVMSPIIRTIISSVACLVLFVTGLLLGGIFGKDNTLPVLDSSIYIDVNPSIEITIDKDNKVITCHGANDDATIILSDLKLEGVDVNTALTAVIGSMYINGYLSEDANSILVSVDSEDDARADLLMQGITERITNVFEGSNMACSIIAQKVSASKELVERAKECGVSVGKMHLVEKMVGAMDEFFDEDINKLSGMSIKELDLIYSSKSDKDEHFGEDIKEGSSTGLGEGDAYSLLLEHLKDSMRVIEDYDFDFKIDHKNGKPRLLYEATIKFAGDPKEYEYTIDCITGEIVEVTEESDDKDEPDRDWHDWFG